MVRVISLLVLAVLLGTATANLLSIVPSHMRAAMPSTLRRDLTKLQTRDVNAAGRVLRRASQFRSVDEAMSTLERESPEMAQLIETYKHGIQQAVKQIKAKLTPGSEQFFKDVGELSKEYGKNVVELYKKQDADTKANLAATFPAVPQALKTPAGQALLKSLSHDH